jgi:hypothetical protein
LEGGDESEETSPQAEESPVLEADPEGILLLILCSIILSRIDLSLESKKKLNVAAPLKAIAAALVRCLCFPLGLS